MKTKGCQVTADATEETKAEQEGQEHDEKGREFSRQMCQREHLCQVVFESDLKKDVAFLKKTFLKVDLFF